VALSGGAFKARSGAGDSLNFFLLASANDAEVSTLFKLWVVDAFCIVVIDLFALNEGFPSSFDGISKTLRGEIDGGDTEGDLRGAGFNFAGGVTFRICFGGSSSGTSQISAVEDLANACLSTCFCRIGFGFVFKGGVMIFFGTGVGSSSSLTGAAKSSSLVGETEEGVRETDLLGTTFNFLRVSGAGDATGAGDGATTVVSSALSGVCEFRVVGGRLNSGIRLRAAFPYVAIFFRGGARS
jgi:hypothetical protein